MHRPGGRKMPATVYVPPPLRLWKLPDGFLFAVGAYISIEERARCCITSHGMKAIMKTYPHLDLARRHLGDGAATVIVDALHTVGITNSRKPRLASCVCCRLLGMF